MCISSLTVENLLCNLQLVFLLSVSILLIHTKRLVTLRFGLSDSPCQMFYIHLTRGITRYIPSKYLKLVVCQSQNTIYSAGEEKFPLFIFLHDQLPFFLGELMENFSRKSNIFSWKYLYFSLKFKNFVYKAPCFL